MLTFYWICKIVKWTETGSVLPASDVIVKAVELSAGFLTVNIELIEVVVTIANYLTSSGFSTYKGIRKCDAI